MLLGLFDLLLILCVEDEMSADEPGCFGLGRDEERSRRKRARKRGNYAPPEESEPAIINILLGPIVVI